MGRYVHSRNNGEDCRDASYEASGECRGLPPYRGIEDRLEGVGALLKAARNVLPFVC